MSRVESRSGRDNPTGAIPRVERQRDHRHIVRTVTPDAVALPITHARRLAKDGLTAAEYFGEEPTVVTTPFVPAEQLQSISWEDEFSIIADVRPDVHVPTYHPVYAGSDRTTRVEAARSTAEGAVWMRQQLINADIETAILPMLVGGTPEIRDICYSGYDAVGWDAAVVDDRASTTVDYESITAERPNTDLYVVGRFAPSAVRSLPDAAVGVFGMMYWVTNVDAAAMPRDMVMQFRSHVNDVDAAVRADD